MLTTARKSAKKTKRAAKRRPAAHGATARRKTVARKPAPRPTSRPRKTKRTRKPAKPAKRWSKRVTETSDALDLEQSVFKQRSPRRIAASLKRSAERSTRRRSSSYQSAMSMLNFYVNRAGKNLPASTRQRLERAKDELRALYGRSSKD